MGSDPKVVEFTEKLFVESDSPCVVLNFKVLVKHNKMIGGENITQLIFTKLPIYLKPK